MMPSSSSICGRSDPGARAVAFVQPLQHQPAQKFPWRRSVRRRVLGKLRRAERKLERAARRQFVRVRQQLRGGRGTTTAQCRAAGNGRRRPSVSPDAAAAAACGCGSTAQCRTPSGRTAWRSGRAGRRRRDGAAPPPRPGASPPGKTPRETTVPATGRRPTATKPSACAASSVAGQRPVLACGHTQDFAARLNPASRRRRGFHPPPASPSSRAAARRFH